MSKTHAYNSVLAPYIVSYLKENEEIRGHSKHLSDILKTFDNYLQNAKHDRCYFTQDDYEKWVKNEENIDIRTFGEKQHILVKFLSHMSRMGQECFIPRPVRVSRARNTFMPYIYSHKEILSIFSAADNMRVPKRIHNSMWILMPLLLRTLYSTGMRLGEALKLKNKDVLLDKGIFDLHQTKNGHQRICAINESLRRCIEQYLEYRDRIPVEGIAADESRFFVSCTGKSPRTSTVYAAYRKILSNAGIQHNGSWKGPNIHGIRHTACVHALLRLVENGKDMYCNLPVLSAYLGHIHHYDTERYIHLTQEMYPDITKKDALLVRNIDEIIINSLKNNEK